MDSPALERLGHHVVSRRVALGYRNRTDLADSVQFTVRTLSDIEHGVRKASPGTYAMLENKLAWAPGSIDTILAGGEPNELVPTLHRTNPNPRPRNTHRARASPTPYRRRPPRNCCWSCGGASSPRAADATTPGTTGTAASTHAATGPLRGSSPGTARRRLGVVAHRVGRGHQDGPGAGAARTTVDTYSHLWPDADESTRSAVGAVLAKRMDSLTAADGLGCCHALTQVSALT